MTPSEDDAQHSYLPNEFEIQRINNRVLGFPEETTPILTPQKDCQVLAFGTLEALLANIQRYNEAFATIQSTPHIDDPHSATPALVSLINAGNDIQKIGAYLRCVQLLDDEWHLSPGVQLLLSLDTTTDPASFALEARDKRYNQLKSQREELARKKALYEYTEKVRKEKLNKAILEGISVMMSHHTRRRETGSPTASSPPVNTGIKVEATPDVTIQHTSDPTTVEDFKSDDEPPVSATGNRAKKTAPAAPVKPKTKNTSSQKIPYQDVVVEVPSPESLKGVKRKRAAESSTKPKPQPKRRLVGKLIT